VNLNSASTSDVVILTSAGYPEGSQIDNSLAFVPALLYITPNVGATSGTLIRVTGSGFGIEDDDA